MVPRSSGAVVNGRAKMAMYDDVTGNAGLSGVEGGGAEGERAEGSGRPVWNLCRCLREGGWRSQGENRQPTRPRNSYYDRRTAEEIPVSPRRSSSASLANAPLCVAIFLPARDWGRFTLAPPSAAAREPAGTRITSRSDFSQVLGRQAGPRTRGRTGEGGRGVVLEYPLPRAICGNVRGPQSDGRRTDRS